jgi:hypothetical protein
LNVIDDWNRAWYNNKIDILLLCSI